MHMVQIVDLSKPQPLAFTKGITASIDYKTLSPRQAHLLSHGSGIDAWAGVHCHCRPEMPAVRSPSPAIVAEKKKHREVGAAINAHGMLMRHQPL